MNLTQGFLNFALATGAQWVMVVLLLCSVLSITIIVERILYFQKFHGNFSKFIQILSQKFTQHEQHDKIAAWCSGQTLLEARVAAAGLEKSNAGACAAEESMYANMIAAKVQLERGTVILGTLGNNTPFIGLFGTIIGIIQAFHALSLETGQNPEALMAAISEALVATALGILVAIPAVIAYNFINRSIKKKLSNADATASIVLTHMNDTSSQSKNLNLTKDAHGR